MVYASSTIYLFRRLQMTIQSLWPHAALHIYNWRQVELFYIQWLIVDILTGTRFMSLWHCFRSQKIRTDANFKRTNLITLKLEWLFNYKKYFRFKSWHTRFLRTILVKHKNLFFTHIIYLDFCHAIFMWGIDSASSFHLKKQFRRQN